MVGTARGARTDRTIGEPACRRVCVRTPRASIAPRIPPASRHAPRASSMRIQEAGDKTVERIDGTPGTIPTPEAARAESKRRTRAWSPGLAPRHRTATSNPSIESAAECQACTRRNAGTGCRGPSTTPPKKRTAARGPPSGSRHGRVQPRGATLSSAGAGSHPPYAARRGRRSTYRAAAARRWRPGSTPRRSGSATRTPDPSGRSGRRSRSGR